MGFNTFPLGISFCLAIGARDIDQIEVRLNARNQFRSKIDDFGFRAHSSVERAVRSLRIVTKCLVSIEKRRSIPGSCETRTEIETVSIMDVGNRSISNSALTLRPWSV